MELFLALVSEVAVAPLFYTVLFKNLNAFLVYKVANALPVVNELFMPRFI